MSPACMFSRSVVSLLQSNSMECRLSVHEILQIRHWSGLPIPPPGDLPNPGIEPRSLLSPALQAGSLPAEPSGKPMLCHRRPVTDEETVARGPCDWTTGQAGGGQEDKLPPALGRLPAAHKPRADLPHPTRGVGWGEHHRWP